MRPVGFGLLAFCLALAGAVPPVAAAEGARATGDPEAGAEIFRKTCRKCHDVGPDARRRAGPPLNNVLHRRAAQVADYRYSEALRKAAEEGLHWTPETLDAFLADPDDFLPKTKMRFGGLRSERQRADVIAYLETFSGDDLARIRDEDFTVPPEVLAIEGDLEYGEYLSSECTTCHQADGDNDGIPSIVGWDEEAFVTAMHAYKARHRNHPVMSMIAGRLGDEEIAALAAYFARLGE